MSGGWDALVCGCGLLSIAGGARAGSAGERASWRIAPRRRARGRGLQFQSQGHPDVRLHPVHRPPAARRSRQHASAKWIWPGWRIRLVQEHENWRLSWDFDAVGATSGGAWRAGGYMKLIHTPHPKQAQIEVVTSTESAKASDNTKDIAPFTHPY